jgi:hypothetical protein
VLNWPVGELSQDECEAKWVHIDGIDLAGRYVLISPTAAWPQNLVYTVNGTNSSSEFKVQACNRRTRPTSPAPTVPESTYTFNYAVLGP